MIPKWQKIEAVAIIVVGMFALQATGPQDAAAATLGPSCLEACCFCVETSSAVCESGSGSDGECFSEGCGPFIECNNLQHQCAAGETEIECADPA
jgi:hypothetical protein